MGIEEVAAIIGRIADGFEDACMDCLADNSGTVLDSVREQLYAGMDGQGNHLSPTYLDDPYLVNRSKPWLHIDNDSGKIYIGPQGYLDWKMDITPPKVGEMLGLPPRPEAVPNLFIDGTFHRQIRAARKGNALEIDAGGENSADIIGKYGDRILGLGEDAVGYFNANLMLPAIDAFFKTCGYR